MQTWEQGEERVREMRAAGQSEQEIAEALQAEGWTKEDAEALAAQTPAQPLHHFSAPSDEKAEERPGWCWWRPFRWWRDR